MIAHEDLPLVVTKTGRVFRQAFWNGVPRLHEENGSEVIVGLLSATCRFLNFTSDVPDLPDLVGEGISDAEADEVARGLEAASRGLDMLRICGSDTGAEDISLMLTKMARWIRTRDREAARREFTLRYRPQKAPLMARLRDRVEELRSRWAQSSSM